MIAAKELRIGNLILFYKIETKVESWMFIQKLKNMHPIPLTSDMLLKCGFISDNYGSFYTATLIDKQELWIKHYDDGKQSGWSPCIDFGDCMKYLPDTNSVHKLQNLYYALTQTELRIRSTTTHRICNDKIW